MEGGVEYLWGDENRTMATLVLMTVITPPLARYMFGDLFLQFVLLAFLCLSTFLSVSTAQNESLQFVLECSCGERWKTMVKGSRRRFAPPQFLILLQPLET